MKYLILIGCFVCSISGYSQYTAIPDPNFENYLEQNGMGDGVPNNGRVLTSNINSVTNLGISMLGISDLTGIEDFIALEGLGCADNQLVTLDLSANINLASLNLISNNLTNLILPPSNDLYIIYCDENFLTELDISQNPNLEELSCVWNLLTGLDITQNPNLGYLFCGHNEIEGYFDTTQNPSLVFFSAYNNNITEVDFTQNPVLNTFGGFSNPLENVDVRNGNNAIMQTFDVTDSNGLKCILVDDASASYLDDWLKDPGTTFVNNQAECDALGVAASTLQDFTMYPNPAISTVAINLPNQGVDGLIVTVTNNLGQVLESKEPLENTTVIKLDVSGYAAGVYFVTLKTGNGIATKKLVVH